MDQRRGFGVAMHDGMTQAYRLRGGPCDGQTVRVKTYWDGRLYAPHDFVFAEKRSDDRIKDRGAQYPHPMTGTVERHRYKVRVIIDTRGNPYVQLEYDGPAR